ncbi:magnesium/cobalt transporter CorA [Pseudaeromonas paramecii]|uniref:Magnesium transport protein CorA n=1 Tax=Pseudaeromonas paramecii TaxID=2138166 RepID=A0ABP8Q0Z9_9GAMM
MITAYMLHNQVLEVVPLTTNDVLPPNTIWLDAYKPDDDEREWLSGLFLEDVPEEEELDEIEASARFYWDTDGLHILSLFPQRIGGETRGVNMSFTLRNNLLISFREEDIGVVRLLRHYLRHDRVEITDAMDVLLELQDLKVEYLSDLIEDGYTTLEETSEQVLNDDEIYDMLKELMEQEETNSQIRLALHDTRRALRFVRRTVRQQLTNKQKKAIDEVLHDIESLLPHTQFLFDKINFQLEAAMGFTNLQQNKVIKIFSVAAVVFLPPTWIASIYGMNFERMPELSWAFGYPFSIGLMLISAFATYYFFKRRGWL